MVASITKYRFILGLNFLKIREPLGKGDQIIDKFRITNDKSVARNFMGRDLREALGGLEGLTLLNSEALIYHEDSVEGKFEPEDSLRVLTRLLHVIGLFTSALWMVKDNAVNFELGFLEVWSPVGGYRAHSNFLAMVVSKADGTKQQVEFSRSDIRAAREFYQDFLLPLFFWTSEELDDVKNINLEQDNYVVSSHPKVPRLSRAFYFLESARSNRDLGMKVAMYCSLYEALFSTDATEITHKISHRIAMFLEQDSDKRRDVYSRVKKAYGIRSKVVHGDELGKDLDKIQAISVDADEIARRILKKISSSENLTEQFHASKSNLDEYFLKESFGGTIKTV